MRNLSRFSILIVNIQVFLFDYNLWDTKWCILKRQGCSKRRKKVEYLLLFEE